MKNLNLGFTLIEAVVSVSVFALAVTSMVGVYTAVQKLNQQSAALQVLQQNGRFITEDITKIIRNGQIDYARYPSATVPQPSTGDLYVIDRNGVRVRIYRSGNDLIIDKAGIGSTVFTGREVRVLTFQAYIWPSQDPYAGGSVSEQPTVTMFLDLESNINQRDKVRIPFQITVSTRQYPE